MWNLPVKSNPYRHIVREEVLDPLSIFFQEVLEEVPKVFEELYKLQSIQISPEDGVVSRSSSDG